MKEGDLSRSRFPLHVGSPGLLARFLVNRHITAANKKASKLKGALVDERAISINTYLGSVYAKRVEFTSGCTLIQDASKARCSGATIWIEARFESLMIDGVAADRAMFKGRNNG